MSALSDGAWMVQVTPGNLKRASGRLVDEVEQLFPQGVVHVAVLEFRAARVGTRNLNDAVESPGTIGQHDDTVTEEQCLVDVVL